MTAHPPPIGVLCMAHGTPATLEEVEPFYTRIRRGSPPSPELLAELVSRYQAIGGTSPLAMLTIEQARAVQAALDDAADVGDALRGDAASRAPGSHAHPGDGGGRGEIPRRFKVFSGNKHTSPSIEEAVAAMSEAGIEQAIGLVLAPQYSMLTSAEYFERADKAAASCPRSVKLSYVSSWHLAEGFVELLGRGVRERLERLGELDPSRVEVIFTAHSLPERVVRAGDPYPDQVRETADAVASRAGLEPGSWSQAFQSAGRTSDKWIGPDLRTVIEERARQGRRALVVCPVGFSADNLELLYDIDIEAARWAHDAGVTLVRVPAPNSDPLLAASLAGEIASASDRMAQPRPVRPLPES